MDKNLKSRKENRIKGYQYDQPGYYFIALCTFDKQRLFGKIVNDEMIKNDLGKMVDMIWHNIPKYYNGFDVDEFIVMPNHIHLIIEIHSETQLSLFDVMGRIKTYTSNEYLRMGIKKNPNLHVGKLWQRSYYDRVIRNDDDLNRVREYIRDNPVNWGNKKGT
ncbi:MAG: transposase [Candidatus Delongbacteria bacterium]|jgi:putative transposase|nr:transposase [Candidatus Delongbacteria bacterium]